MPGSAATGTHSRVVDQYRGVDGLPERPLAGPRQHDGPGPGHRPLRRIPQGPPVTDDQMADFLKNQFALAGNLTVSKVEARADRDARRAGVPDRDPGTSSNRSWQHTPALFFGICR